MVNHGIVKPRFLVMDSQYDSATVMAKTLQRAKKLCFPLFVKPARAGSSVGITKVKSLAQLGAALTVARAIDQKIILEEAVVGCKEIEVSVLGNGYGSIEVSLPARVIPGADFYDYDDKYKNNTAQFEVPANLPRAVIDKIQTIARQAYSITQCRGLARVDFLLGTRNQVFLNEINTMPGFTPISMYPRMWEATGVSYQQLITRLIMLAFDTK
jgi:D-alanine-D-alanine ligase